MMKNLFFSSGSGMGRSLGVLVLRLSVGLMMAFAHGLGKIQMFMNSEIIQFADPIGLGHEMSLLLAAGAEFFCSLLLVIGLMTRLATIPLIITMMVAVFIVHANDPFQKMEFGLLYLFPYIAILLMGPGKFSVDYLLTKKS